MATTAFDEHVQKIEQTLVNQWVTADALVEFPGGRKVQPLPGAAQKHWCRLTILPGVRNRITCGTGTTLRRQSGVIVFQIFCPEEDGTKYGRQLADKFVAIYEDKEFLIGDGSKIQCRSATGRFIGSDGRGYFQINVEVPYIHDKIE